MNIYDIKIGDTITIDKGLEIAKHLDIEYVIERIENNPDTYTEFIFDGCSCIPDEMLGLFTGCKWKDITYMCCLPHDIQYAYGRHGDDFEKEYADELFKDNLIKKAKMNSWMAKIFLFAVKTGGVEELGFGFSWGFANK